MRLCGRLLRELTLLVRAHSLMSGKRETARGIALMIGGEFHWTRYQVFSCWTIRNSPIYSKARPHSSHHTMAASRNMMVRASRTLAFASSTSRTITTRAPWRASFQQPSSRTSIFAATRSYSSETPSSTVEPPDFLDEGELKVFKMLKEGLNPIRLEVSGKDI